MKKVLFVTLILLTATACSGIDASPMEAVQPSGGEENIRIQKQSQALIQIDFDKKSIERDLVRYVRKRHDLDICRLDRMEAISVGKAFQILETYPVDRDFREAYAEFVYQHQESVLPVVARFRDAHGVNRMLLKFVYNEHLNMIGMPPQFGCSGGLIFEFSKHFSSVDPSDPPPKPTSCLFHIGSVGECCHCDAAWSDEEGCLQSDNCPNSNCCHSEQDFLDRCDFSPY